MTNNDKTKTLPAPRPAFRAMPADELAARRARLGMKGREIFAAGRAWCKERKAKMEKQQEAAQLARKEGGGS